MHRTTIPLEGVIEQELRKLAAREKKSFKELVNDLLKKGLKFYKEVENYKVELSWNTSKAVPVKGFDPSDRSTYLDIISKKIR